MARAFSKNDINNIIVHNEKEKAIDIILENGYAVSRSEAKRIYYLANWGKDENGKKGSIQYSDKKN